MTQTKFVIEETNHKKSAHTTFMDFGHLASSEQIFQKCDVNHFCERRKIQKKIAHIPFTNVGNLA